MKSLKNVLYILVIVGALAAQSYYLATIYKQDQIQISDNLREIKSTEARIELLKKRLAHYEESKQELKKIQNEREAIMKTIPDETSYAQSANQLYSYLGMIDGFELEVKNTEVGTVSSVLGEVNSRTYDISFISTYTDSRKFLEHLSRMYQVSHVNEYEFDTEKQIEGGEDYLKYRIYFGKHMQEVGTTKVNLTVYYRMVPNLLDEYYQVDGSQRISCTPFKNSRTNKGEIPNEAEDAEIADLSRESEQVSSPLLEGSSFLFNIGDILTSGDTYKLSGPGNDEAHYIGMNSQSSMEVGIDVYEDHYDLSLKDQNGQVKESSVVESIKAPNLTVISTMRELEEVMPNIHITVCNYTEEEMPISLSGNMIDNIHVYDKTGDEVSKGESHGMIHLT